MLGPCLFPMSLRGYLKPKSGNIIFDPEKKNILWILDNLPPGPTTFICPSETLWSQTQEFLPSYAFLLHPLSHLQGLLPVVWRGQATQKSIVTLKAAKYQVSVVRSKTRHLVVPATGPWKNTCLGSKKPLALFCWPWWPPWQRQQKHSMFLI